MKRIIRYDKPCNKYQIQAKFLFFQGIQIVIVIYDVNSPESTNDVIDVFIVDITSSPGVQLPLRQYHGIYRIVQASFSFKVTCASGFYGPGCSTNCTGPVRTDCLECKTGYYGQFCSIRQDSCELNSCYNNGNCLQNGSCVCNQDYSGQFCQQKIDDCQNVDCRNGTCIDGINSYNCSCHIDYISPHCDQVKGTGHRVLQTASVLTKWVVSSVYANQIIPADCAILALITVWVWSALVPRPCVWMRSIHSDVTAKKDSLERTVTFPQSLLRETVILVFHKVSQSEKTTTTT